MGQQDNLFNSVIEFLVGGPQAGQGLLSGKNIKESMATNPFQAGQNIRTSIEGVNQIAPMLGKGIGPQNLVDPLNLIDKAITSAPMLNMITGMNPAQQAPAPPEEIATMQENLRQQFQVPGFGGISKQADMEGVRSDVKTIEDSVQPLQKAPATTDTKKGGGNIFDILAPLIATGVGLGVPGALPGAAGFATGFTKEKTRQTKAQEDLNKIQRKTEADLAKTVAVETIKAELKRLNSTTIDSPAQAVKLQELIKDSKKWFGGDDTALNAFLADNGLALDKNEIRANIYDTEGALQGTVPLWQKDMARAQGFIVK